MARKNIADLEQKIAQLKARKLDLQKKEAALAKRMETNALIAFARFMHDAAESDVARTAAEWLALHNAQQGSSDIASSHSTTEQDVAA